MHICACEYDGTGQVSERALNLVCGNVREVACIDGTVWGELCRFGTEDAP